MRLKPRRRNPLLAAIGRYGALVLALLALLAALAVILTPTETVVRPGNTDGAQPTGPRPTPTLDPIVLAPLLQLPPAGGSGGTTLVRQPEPFTIMPDRPRTTVLTYTVQEGDTVFGIAEQFSLKPETIFWGNAGTLHDVHMLGVGMTLSILPTDGALQTTNGRQTIQSIANRYGVDPYDIIFSEYNDLGDANPNTAPPANTRLVIPGGVGEMPDMIPRVTVEGSGAGGGAVRVTGGPGSCGLVRVNTGGRGVFSLPITGYTFTQDFYPGIHYGVDLAAAVGTPVMAADSGTVVFAGWHNGGFGYLVVIDHGNGFQTYYGHLLRINVRCSAGVSAGQVIGAVGSTGNSSGPHLHFEMQQNGVPVNPHIHLIL
jgi:murein DD-endopeptidase MepM/ murein hydrolase activator NlpD